MDHKLLNARSIPAKTLEVQDHPTCIEELLGLHDAELAQGFAVDADTVKVGDVTSIHLHPPSNVVDDGTSEKRKWAKAFSEKWNRARSQIHAHQPRRSGLPRSYDVALALQKMRSGAELANDQLAVLLADTEMESPRGFVLPSAHLEKGDNVVINCHSRGQLELAAALGIRFPQSQLLARRFFAANKLVISPDGFVGR